MGAVLLPAAAAAPEDEPQRIPRWKDRHARNPLQIVVRKHQKISPRTGKLSGQVTTQGWDNLFCWCFGS